jgi:hypothetical protein
MLIQIVYFSFPTIGHDFSAQKQQVQTGSDHERGEESRGRLARVVDLSA